MQLVIVAEGVTIRLLTHSLGLFISFFLSVSDLNSFWGHLLKIDGTLSVLFKHVTFHRQILFHFPGFPSPSSAAAHHVDARPDEGMAPLPVVGVCADRRAAQQLVVAGQGCA